ncbi:NUDIX hydrolase [Planosporangium thailandense]|uniref:NUDIX hydrolase n=1 Tax=Planosporangium thailandense TaxID=765197 RepID=A0ABX0Y2P8_9ACTN|nr:NUDIX hydrolase [Planosporangium thailandense]
MSRSPTGAPEGSSLGAPVGCCRELPDRGVEYGRSVTEGPAELTRWTIHGERVIDDTRRARWSIAEVELPDGVRFEQYVLRLPKAAIVVVLDEDDRVLMMWRHRFIIDRWVWELPGGYVDESEDPATTAAREVEEETGWRPRSIEPLLSFQPMVGTADAENLLFLARGADYVGTPEDVNEAERIDWIPLDKVLDYIARGEIVGAASVVGILDVLARRQRGELEA